MSRGVLHRRKKVGSIPRKLEETVVDPFDDVFVSPCQVGVSNDPLNPLLTDEPMPCNVTTYECFDSSSDAANPSTSPSNLTISFNYEVYHIQGANLERSLEGIEGAMLQHLAVLTGLEDCPVSQSTTDRGKRKLQFLNTEEEAVFLGITSRPVDVEDTTATGCVVPVEPPINTVCQPVLGAMTAFVSIEPGAHPSLEESITDVILQVVRQGMIDNVYAIGNVRKVSFVENQVIERPPANALGQSNSSGGSGLSRIGIAVICAGVLVVVVGLIAAIFYRRRRQKMLHKGMLFEDSSLPSEDVVVSVQEEDSIQREKSPFDNRDGIIIEGSDVPGSLAATDALALKPSTGDRRIYLSRSGMTDSASSSAPSPPIRSPDSEASNSTSSTSYPQASSPGRVISYNEIAASTPQFNPHGESTTLFRTPERKLRHSASHHRDDEDDLHRKDSLADSFARGVDSPSKPDIGQSLTEDEEDSIHRLVRIA